MPFQPWVARLLHVSMHPCRLANKQDIPSSLTEADISAEMGLDKLTMCRHRVVPCVARPGSFGGKIDDRIWEGALAFFPLYIGLIP